jgi:GNAT superfamily N-acetyltransferase
MNKSINLITIRKVDVTDLPKISILANQLGYPNRSEDLLDRLKIIRSNHEQEIFIADYIHEKTVGFIHLSQEVSLVSGLFVEVRSFVVDEDHRRLGIGNALLQAAEEWTINAGCNQIRLRSNIIRQEAHEFYKIHRYLIEKTQYSFHKKLV